MQKSVTIWDSNCSSFLLKQPLYPLLHGDINHQLKDRIYASIMFFLYFISGLVFESHVAYSQNWVAPDLSSCSHLFFFKQQSYSFTVPPCRFIPEIASFWQRNLNRAVLQSSLDISVFIGLIHLNKINFTKSYMVKFSWNYYCMAN